MYTKFVISFVGLYLRKFNFLVCNGFIRNHTLIVFMRFHASCFREYLSMFTKWQWYSIIKRLSILRDHYFILWKKKLCFIISSLLFRLHINIHLFFQSDFININLYKFISLSNSMVFGIYSHCIQYSLSFQTIFKTKENKCIYWYDL